MVKALTDTNKPKMVHRRMKEEEEKRKKHYQFTFFKLFLMYNSPVVVAVLGGQPSVAAGLPEAR